MESAQGMQRVASHPGAEELAEFYLGMLPAEALQTVADHLDGCHTCQTHLESLHGQEDALIAGLQQPASAEPFSDEPACRKALEQVQAIGAGSAQSLDTAHGPASDLPGQGRLGQYQLLNPVGQGGMGTVYRALHTRLKRVVALKVLSARRIHDPAAVARFQREMEAVGKLNHPHIVRATDAGDVDGVHYLVMDYVEGIDLARLVSAGGALPVANACELVRQAAVGLQHAHEHGLVHRDIKPSNLLLDSEGKVKMLDLGLALLQDNSELTATGQVMGTFDYMAPEQGDDTHLVDIRADIYSLGCTLYHLLAGHAPFSGPAFPSFRSKMRAHAQASIPPITKRLEPCPAGLSAVLDRMLAKEPGSRFATPAEVAEALMPFSVGSDLPALWARARLIPKTAFQPSMALVNTDQSLAGTKSTYHPRATPLTPENARTGPAATSRRTILIGLAALVVLTAGVIVASQFQPKKDIQLDSFPNKPSRPNPEDSANPALVKAEPIAEAKTPPVYPAALFLFVEHGDGAKDMGAKVTDLLFARLSARPDLFLVDRDDLHHTLEEAELGLSGIVKPAEAAKVGQLTGAKILITGSVNHSDKMLYLVAKVIGTESSRILGVSVEGKASDELAPLVGKLADKVAETIKGQADKLVPKPESRVDRLAALVDKLKKGKHPSVLIQVRERQVGAAPVDPAAQTELSLFCKETGFEVIDAEEGAKGKADLLLTGEGLSELAGRHGSLVTVKARLEVKAVDRLSGKVLAVDRQTVVVVDLTEQLAGKAALQEAAAELAERLLPKLVKE